MITNTNSSSMENSYLYDNMSSRLMTDAVTLYPCGHTLCSETVQQLRKKVCPYDSKHIKGVSPNILIRNLAKEMQESIDKETAATSSGSDQDTAAANSNSIAVSIGVANQSSAVDAKAQFLDAAEKGLSD